MKSIIILYPIQEYVDALIDSRELPEIKEKYISIYQNLIHQRYPDFQLIYVMFSENENPENPNMSQLWQGISIEEKDIIGACGISLSQHCQEQIYPNPEKIIDLCPCPIDELVIVGFHLWDCVEKIAEYAYKQGIKVMVDEDLTEVFFGKVINNRGIPSSSCIPLLREESIEKDRREFMESSPCLLELTRNSRKEKPWLAKI